ncbi:H-2 class II histocompatibility I-E beta chain-like protein [Labeo rohita]|uniref:H-2 class II histocompatibility I-E beta chain-like protein n=2 Tax=Labeo rohita TaxID=84645 RepID=A0A498MHX0_LABRO|nr:H-2 class II histocompatibility I-E beta chain-like protein [Labeo rohita]
MSLGSVLQSITRSQPQQCSHSTRTYLWVPNRQQDGPKYENIRPGNQIRKDKYAPGVTLRSITEATDAPDNLSLVAANGASMPYSGWVEISFKLASPVTKQRELIIPVLVLKDQELARPIIGVQNGTDHDITLRGRRELGTLQQVKSLLPVAPPQCAASTSVIQVSPETTGGGGLQDSWDPPVDPKAKDGIKAQPKVKVSSVTQAGGRHPAVLMCSAYEFYPPQIKVSWLRDGKPVTSEVTSTMEMADGDWYYQIHSELEYSPKSGEKISCMIEHASFNKPMIHDWDPSLLESERNKIAIGASGLVLGIIIAATGIIYFKKKSTGRILVPQQCSFNF